MRWGLAGTGNASAAAVVTAAVIAPQNVRLGGNGFLRDWVSDERSRRETTAILIVRTLQFFFWTLKKGNIPKNRLKNVAVTFLGVKKISKNAEST